MTHRSRPRRLAHPGFTWRTVVCCARISRRRWTRRYATSSARYPGTCGVGVRDGEDPRRAAEALGVCRLLVAVASLDLVGQWAQAARADGRCEAFLAVSSVQADKHPLLARAGAVSTGSGEYLAYCWLSAQSGVRKRRCSSRLIHSCGSRKPGTAPRGAGTSSGPWSTTARANQPTDIADGLLPGQVPVGPVEGSAYLRAPEAGSSNVDDTLSSSPSHPAASPRRVQTRESRPVRHWACRPWRWYL